MPARRPPRARGLALALALVLSSSLGGACRATESLEPPRAPELVSAEPLPVTLSRSLRLWKASTSSFGQKTNFRFGALLERLFPAQDGRSFLSPINGELETRWNDAERSWEATYTFALALQVDGVHHSVVALGRGSSDDPVEADRDALEDCVAKIYAQVSTLLAGRGG